MSILFATALVLAAPETCSETSVAEAFNSRKWARAEKIALDCASKDEPKYYFYAAQAQGEQRHWIEQRQSLRMFLKAVSKSHPDRAEAEKMLAKCEKRLEKPPPPKPTDEVQQTDPGTPKTGGESGGDPPTGPGDTSSGASGETLQTQVPKPADIEQPKPVDESTPAYPQHEPRYRGLWIGIGVAVGTSVLTGTTTALAGYLGGTKPARQDNDAVLAKYGLPADFKPAEGSPEQMMKAEQLEDEYSSKEYYKSLSFGLTREGAGTILGTAGVGLALGMLPDLVRNVRGRRAGFVILIASGAAMLAGGATAMSLIDVRLDRSFSGYDPDTNPDAWRAGGLAYYDLRRNYLLSAGLAGLGIGLVVGGTSGALVRWRDRPVRDDERACLRIRPMFNGLTLTGRF